MDNFFVLFCFFFSDASGHVKFWHYTSGKCLQTIVEDRQALTFTINPEGTHILTAGSEPQIHMYNIETKQRTNTLEPRFVGRTEVIYFQNVFLWLLQKTA